MGTQQSKGWVACHDTLVCTGAAAIQKWCVRERDKNGPLVAVMLTKGVAHALAAAPELKAVVDGLLVFRVEENREYVWLRYADQDICAVRAGSPAGVALLKLEADRRAAAAKAEGRES